VDLARGEVEASGAFSADAAIAALAEEDYPAQRLDA
jgi:copper chaperone